MPATAPTPASSLRPAEELLDTGQVEWRGEVRSGALTLSLGDRLLPLVAANEPVDPRDSGRVATLYGSVIDGWTSYALQPQKMVLVEVEHPLRLAADVYGWMSTLSHIARLGLMTRLDSPFVAPGWSGHLTLELLNVGPAPLLLTPGLRVGRVLLFLAYGFPATNTVYGNTGEFASRYAEEFGRGL